MAIHGKKYVKSTENLDRMEVFAIKEGLQKAKDLKFSNFDESVDVDMNLGIDATKSDQIVRGSVMVPHAKGRKVRVIVFAKEDYAMKAEAAGADEVGASDLIEKISGGWLEFDFAVATPDLMGQVGKLAKLLGPKGLLPNKKLGTVTFDVAEIVGELKKGRQFFRNDKAGIVHFSIGKTSQSVDELYENLGAFVKSVLKAKPTGAKGKYIQKASISSTMGPGLKIGIDAIL